MILKNVFRVRSVLSKNAKKSGKFVHFTDSVQSKHDFLNTYFSSKSDFLKKKNQTKSDIL